MMTLPLLYSINFFTFHAVKTSHYSVAQKVAIDRPITGNIDRPITGNSVKLPKV